MSLKKIIYNALGKTAKQLERKGKKRRTSRGYNIASGRLFSDWNNQQISANSQLEPVLKQMRNNARDLYINSDYVRRFVGLMKVNVVGHAGIMLKMKVMQNGKADVVANSKIQAGWARLCKLGTTTVCGRYSFIDLLKQVIHSIIIDGESIVRITPYKNSPVKFSLQIIEADHLDETLNKTLSNGNQIKMGVEVDKFNRAVAYWFLKYHPGDVRNNFNREYERVPADKILHMFVPERPGQVRGVTWVCSSPARLKMLDGFEEASLVGARVGASTMGIIYNEDGEEWGGDEPENIDDDNEAESGDGDVIFTAEAGTFKQLSGNKRLEQFNPATPSASFAEFVKSILRGVSSGWGVSYENLANDRSGSSYSSMRQAELSDRDFYRAVQVFLIEHCCQPIFEHWLYEAIALGDVKLPLYKIDQFNAATWRPRGWQWVDPDKESKAAERDISNSIESAEDIAARRGNDIYENIEENLNVKVAADVAGLSLPIFADGLSGGTDNTGDDINNTSAELKLDMDAYGVGVRAGAITPQREDEDFYRKKLGIPKITKPVSDAWVDDGGARRPITLKTQVEIDALTDEFEDPNSEDEKLNDEH